MYINPLKNVAEFVIVWRMVSFFCVETKDSGLVKLVPRDDSAEHTSLNPDCPACTAKRMHQREEWTAYHPLAGTGKSKD